jgi:hypothetical protein
MVEFEVGNRPGRAADRLSIHTADETQERSRGRPIAQDISPLLVQAWTANLDQSGVVSPAVKAELPEPCRIELVRRFGGHGLTAALLIEALYGWVFS